MGLSTAHKLDRPTMATDLVMDVGLYTGEDTAYYLHRGYRVVAIDANPIMIERAERRFAAEISAQRLVLLNIGIFTSGGAADFWISSHDDWSSFDKNNASKLRAKAHSISVECVRFDQILERYGVPFYLKIDIEKLDGSCLEALTPACRPRYVSWEASSNSLVELETMKNLGYDAFKCIDQRTLRACSLDDYGKRKRSALGRTIAGLRRRKHGGWEFDRGLSSGPFGEDTDGDWRPFAEIANEFSAFRKNHPDDDQWPTWFDFHATTRTVSRPEQFKENPLP
jgi:FkbM family methyltransferase